MSKRKVLITDYQFKSIEYEKKILSDIGAEVIGAQCKTENEVIEKAKGVDGLIVECAPITRKVIESLPRLKVVARYGIGIDVIDLKAASEHKVFVLNVPDYCIDEVSDHALALLLGSARKIIPLNNHIKSGNWGFHFAQPFYRIKGRTLGLIGFGNIARKLAEKAKPLGLSILICDPYISNEVMKNYEYVKNVDFLELLKKSDFISIHVPLTKNTKNMISIKEINLMKKSAAIINTSRGGIINEKDLTEALISNRIAGAALDVFEEEPLNNILLLKQDNVILTPHVSYHSEESQIELQTKAAEGVRDVLLGKRPKYLINKEIWNQNIKF
jgi:D-3-phosphoglycerate dehydrogenase